MSLVRLLKLPFELLPSFVQQPRQSVRFLRALPLMLRGFTRADAWKDGAAEGPAPSPQGVPELEPSNPLRTYFDSHTEGKGIWKWTHYFDIYHRHFSKFIGKEVHLVEVGIYSGGSLDMWKCYFGPKCRVYGVDIEEACKVYEDSSTRIFIGDQADRDFWKRFKAEVPRVDILIDDGGHYPDQQIVTLEEMLPHLRPGGVFVCEDVHELHNEFSAYVSGLTNQLNASAWRKPSEVEPSPFQKAILSVHLYPFVTVIEKAASPVNELVAPKHGTQWQPFYEE